MFGNATKVETVKQSIAHWPLEEAHELATILDSVLDTAAALISADAYAVWLLESSREEWRIAAGRGLSQTFTDQVRGGADIMPASPVCADDVESEDLLSDRVLTLRREGIRSLMAVPIFIQEERRGTIVFYFRNPHSFSKRDVHVGERLARLSSSALAASELSREQSLARARSDFLAEASAVLASSLDYEQTLATIANLAVPQIADWCAIDLVDGDVLKRVAVAHKDEQKLQFVRDFGHRYPSKLDSGTLLAQTVGLRRSQLVPVIDDSLLERTARDAEHLAALRQLQMRSAVVVPLMHRDEVLGLITLVTAELERSLTEQDRVLAEALASRAAVAIENARLFTALETSERNFRAVSETAACAIFIHDGTRVVYRNRVAAEMIGMEQNETSQMWERVHPHDREMVKARAAARLRGEDPPTRYEFRIVRPDGAVVWLDLTAAAIEYGGAKCILATAFDVTQRRFAVEQMQRREQEARTLLDNLPDVISRFDRNLRHLYVSPHVERLTGRPTSASVGKTFEEIGYPAQLCELWNDSLRRVFAEGAAHSIDFSFQSPDGQTRHFIGTGIPEITRDGVVESVVTFSRDITEQRNTLLQLQASQTQMRLIIDSVPGLVAYVDTEERLRRVNRTFEEWFQRPLKDLLGLTIREISGQNYVHLAPKIAQALAGEEVQFEATNRYADGIRDVLITYVPDTDDSGKVCGFVALILDVTERRKAEDALRKTEKLAAAGRLAASIAHEINNPLESVTNLIYLLNQDPTLSSTGREYVSLAEQELTRVSQIATQTLRFHRQSSRAVPVRVRDLLDAICALYRARFDRLGVTLEHRYRDSDTIQAFEGELRQLFANLIANALDAMPSGGRLLLRTRRTVRADGVRGIQVTVADTGQGIAEELGGRIFEPFVTSKGMTGTGLGLWVSKEIVQKHHGSIRVRSRSNGRSRGTVFVVFLAESPGITSSESRPAD